MKFDFLSFITGAVGLGFVKLIWEGIKFFIVRHDKQITDEQKFIDKQELIEILFNDLLHGAVSIQEYLEECILDNNIARITIIKLENGGGTPQLGTNQHISILNEAIHPDYKEPSGEIFPVKQDFQNFLINSDHQRILMNMLFKGSYTYSVGQSNPVKLLENYYKSNGISKSIFLPITHIPEIGHHKLRGFLLYMSIQFSDDRKIDEKLQYEYSMLKNKIEEIFIEFYVKRIKSFD